MSLTDNPQSFSEDQTLQKFGYQQEFKRELKRFASFAIGFSFISITNGSSRGQTYQYPGSRLILAIGGVREKLYIQLSFYCRGGDRS